MSAAASSIDNITRVDLAELIAMRARAGRAAVNAARVRATLVGGHVSVLRGRGMDYAESRVYQPGDDARNIDWRRTARSGKWHTKLFEAERERSLLLLVDTHATMRFGTRARFKSVAAARAAAWMAWTCVRGGDRVGALAFGPLRAAVDPHAGTRGALATLGAIARWDGLAHAAGSEASGEPLSVAIRRVQRLVAPGSRAWLFSDGWCTDAAAVAALALLARHAELRVVIIADALECRQAPPGCYLFETDAGRSRVDLSRAEARLQFSDRLSQGARKLAEACVAAGIACTTLTTTDEPEVALLPIWRRRDTRP
jgi:uncharacterized protein (DUF58 family)